MKLLNLPIFCIAVLLPTISLCQNKIVQESNRTNNLRTLISQISNGETYKINNESSAKCDSIQRLLDQQPKFLLKFKSQRIDDSIKRNNKSKLDEHLNEIMRIAKERPPLNDSRNQKMDSLANLMRNNPAHLLGFNLQILKNQNTREFN